MARYTTAEIITYGTGRTAIQATGIHLDRGRAGFTLHTPATSAPVTLRLLGAHQVHNALAAAAAAHALGMDTKLIAEALSAAEPMSPGRLQVLQCPGDITIINDAFNANTESMAAGLRSFASYSANRRMVAVLGEMRELGTTAQAAHQAIGHLVSELGISTLIAVGDGHVRDLALAAQSGASPPVTDTAGTPAGLRSKLARVLEPGDVVFIKASRSVGWRTSRKPSSSAWNTRNRHSPGDHSRATAVIQARDLREPEAARQPRYQDYWVAVRARSRTPAVVPTYMSMVMR